MRTLLYIAFLTLPYVGMAQSDERPFTFDPEDEVLKRLDELAAEPWSWNEGRDRVGLLPAAPDSVPLLTDEQIKNRLRALDLRTPIRLTSNEVVTSYVRMYVERRRELGTRILAKAERFYPMFEEALDRHRMPLELKHLAVVESALNPTARSRAGATGLWQFMYHTGKQFGLEVDSYVDERLDPENSTEAACRYLKYLHNMYNDWHLALAAYNCGPGNVNKAIRRAGGSRDHWVIYPFLPRETRGYVPAFIAVNYLMNYASEHNIRGAEPMFTAYQVDTLHICYPVTFQRISRHTGIPVSTLEELNPSYKQGLIPDPERAVSIRIPRDQVPNYLDKEEVICYSREPEEMKALAENEPRETIKTQTTTQRITYVVRQGDVLGKIAERHHVGVGQLMAWNGLSSSRIRPGQRLVIHSRSSDGDGTAQSKTTAKAAGSVAAPVSNTGYRYHTVQKGDTLWDIARLYPGVTVDQIKRLNSGINHKRLSPGDRIKVSKTG